MKNPTPDKTESEFANQANHSSQANHPRGFISVIALGIFAILAIFGIILSGMISHNFNTIRNTENYNTARDTAQSVIDYLEKILAKYEAGYNTRGGTVRCVFNQGAGNRAPGVAPQPGVGTYEGPDDFCGPLLTMIGTRKATVEMEIKGRALVTEGENGGINEKLASLKCGDRRSNAGDGRFTECYVSPLPGTGNAGDRCGLYTPTFGPNAVTRLPENLSNGIPQMDQLNYACNWDRLTFGSSLTDRAAIPLYYAVGEGDCSDPNNVNCVHPYWEDEDEGGGASKFLLRMRTPCLPCVYGDEPAEDGVSRSCDTGDDPNVCRDDERYLLDEEVDDIVVQWQINGICADTGKECGMVAIGDEGRETAVTERALNFALEDGEHYIVLDNSADKGKGIDINTNLPTGVLISIEGRLPQLPLLIKPILSLFLTNDLISNQGRNVPYLEYQFLSNKPIGSTKMKIHTVVDVEGNVYEQTTYIDVKKPLIDFAIQN